MRGGGVPAGHVVDESEFSFLTAAFDYEADQLPPVSALERLKARALRMLRIGND